MPQIKQPGESRIYPFDFANRLGGETIASISAAGVTPRGRVVQVAPLTIAAQAAAASEVRLQLAGGTDGEIYSVRVAVLDTAGQTHEIEGEIIVADLAWTVPDGAAAYLTIQAFVDRAGYDASVRMTDEFGTGKIDKARIGAALADAQAEIDGFLATRYTVPLNPVPPQIATILYDLASARLRGDELPAAVKDRLDAARRQLRDIATGLTTLPNAALQTAATTTDAPVLWSSGKKLFGRANLAGF